MAEIIKVYKQKVPAMWFIGKKYGDEDRVGGSFGAKWGEWFGNGWFDAIEQAAGGASACHELYEDGDAYIGLMRDKDSEPFQYWIGMFVPCGTAVPDGFECLNFPEASLGTAWVYGDEGDVYCHEPECMTALEKAGYEVMRDSENALWCMERYGCPRFTTPDEKGKIILDICFFVK